MKAVFIRGFVGFGIYETPLMTLGSANGDLWYSKGFLLTSGEPASLFHWDNHKRGEDSEDELPEKM
ncbi:MAG: hypothetical protein Tsb009_08370 [Planctomycetaceae bacterium]